MSYRLALNVHGLPAERKDVHNVYLDIYKALPVKVVTAFQGHREWHIARRLSLTSTTTHALIKTLLRHHLDLEFDCIRIVCEFMCPNYNYEDRVIEHARREVEESNKDEAEVAEEDVLTDAHLLEFGVPESAEECEVLSLTARCTMLQFQAGSLPLEELKRIIDSVEDTYLAAFLERAGLKKEKIPKSSKAMRDRCAKWASEEVAERRPFVFMMVSELKDQYRALKGSAPKSVWKADELLTEILRPSDGEAAPRICNNVKDPDSLDQELMNIVVRGMALKKLEGNAKDNCKKEHEMEEVYSKQLLQYGSFPWDAIDEVVRLGCVHKNGLEHIKGSVDRCLGINDLGEKTLYSPNTSAG